jgi:hypothetical protein
MKKIFCIIFLIIVGMDLFAKLPRSSKTLSSYYYRKEKWIIGVGSCCAICFMGVPLLPLPSLGFIIHTPYRIGIEGGFSVFGGIGDEGELMVSIWSIQIIYDIIRISELKWSEEGLSRTTAGFYVGTGIAGYSTENSEDLYSGGYYLKRGDVKGVTISAGFNFTVSDVMMGIKILLLSPWEDRRYWEKRIPSEEIKQSGTTTKNLLFKNVYFLWPVPYISYVFTF